MAGPWEKYLNSGPNPPTGGPWTKYTPSPAGTPAGDSGASAIEDAAKAAQTGAMQGMTFGFADEILGTMMTPIEMGIDAVQGKPLDPGRSWNQAVERNRATDAADQAANPAAATVGNIAAAVGTGGALAKSGVTLLNAAKPTAMSMGARAALEGAAYGAAHGAGAGETLEDKGWDALLGAGSGAVLGAFTGALFGSLANRGAQKGATSVEELKAQAGALYDAARAGGAVAPQQATQALSQTMKGIATAEGLITPLGRVNQSYPKIGGILNTVEDFATGTMDVAQAQAVRKVLTDAAKSAEPGERRIAMLMLDEFDQFLDPLAPQIAQANQIYSRAMKGEAIEDAIELAGSRAGQFSGSGFENALRTEFRAMERAIIKGDLRGLSQPEIDAISQVARGGPIENAARWFGKFAPSGNLSTLAGGGAGFAVAGPVGTIGVLGAGALGRAAATKMTLNNARLAAALGRTGGNALTMPAALPNALQGLSAIEGSQAPKLNALAVRALN